MQFFFNTTTKNNHTKCKAREERRPCFQSQLTDATLPAKCAFKNSSQPSGNKRNNTLHGLLMVIMSKPPKF